MYFLNIKCSTMYWYSLVVSLFMLSLIFAYEVEEEEDPYTSTDPKKREPTPCEVCKMFATELQERLDLSARSKELLETGHGLDKKKTFKYLTSDLRLIEALQDPHVCDKITEYNVHAERKGSNRYAKGRPQTFEALHDLVDKGVKVELGIPYELWDDPSAEVSKMQKKCYGIAERYEEDIEEWYYHHQEDGGIMDYLCRKRYLKHSQFDDSCLDEVFVPEEKTSKKTKKAKKNKKGDTGINETQEPPKEKELPKKTEL